MHAKSKLWSAAVFFGTLLAFFLTPSQAHAQHDLLSKPGQKGQLAIDSLMGFRIGAFSGISYAGPLGFSLQSYSADNVNDNRVQTTTHLTTFWFAPAADYFVIDHLSVGGLLEIASTSGSDKTKNINGVETSIDRQTAIAFTFLPRVGYMIPVNTRFAIWPRGGVGYASRQNAPGGQAKETFTAAIFSIDCPFLYRINETFFVSASPELTFSAAGSHSTNINVADGGFRSADASFFQFGVVTGLGVLLDL